MKQRITVYWPDTSMVSYLREKPAPDAVMGDGVKNGQYHFAPGAVISSDFYSIIHRHEGTRTMFENNGKPSTIVVSDEDDGIIQMTKLEFEERFKDKAKDQQIETLLAEKVFLEDELAHAQNEAEAMAQDAFDRGFEEAANQFQ